MGAASRGDGEGDALQASDVVAVEDGEALADVVERGEDGSLHAQERCVGVRIGIVKLGADLVDHGVALPAEFGLKRTNELERDEHEDGGDQGFEVETGTAGHADGSHDEDGGCAGEAEDLAAGVEDEARAEEANALHDVGGDLTVVGVGIARQNDAHDGEQRCSHADEHVGAKAGVLVAPLALEADCATKRAGHHHAGGCGLGESGGFSAELGEGVGLDHSVRILWRTRILKG